MRTQGTMLKALLGKALILAVVLNGFVGVAPAPLVVQAQNRPIIITADQPNVWTLEQAHYLLAQMHRRNLDLRAKGLDNLDPNEINGLRINVLKSLLEVGASFNDADRVTNNLLRRNQSFNSERRLTLLSQRDQLRSESLSLMRETSQLRRARARATDPEEIERLDTEIDAKTAEHDAVKEEIEFLDNELQGLNAPTGEFRSNAPESSFDPSKLPQGLLDDAFKNAAKKLIEDFNQSPQLNASLRLENYLQLQYEIIAKQLTLLRDEVGPGERLIFLEMPQSINVTHDKADKKWAQSWWKIVGYTTRLKQWGGNQSSSNAAASRAEQEKPSSAMRQAEQNADPITTSENYDSIYQKKAISVTDDEAIRTGGNDESNGIRAQYVTKFINLDDNPNPIQGLENLKLSNRKVRTVELIPRQGSLNVNDMKLQTRAGALTAVASFLFGFGARVNIQRQREQFSQFVQQELYSSAFGKGSREFGWIFTPMPGTDRLLPGVRTTYAVLVVPQEATSIVLDTTGCYFPRSDYQPNNFKDTTDPARWADPNRGSRNCSEHKAFIISIPGGGNDDLMDFRVDGLTYRPVKKGDRIVVSIYGKNFSSQLGVLVNGVPLTPSLGLAQPFILDDSNTGKTVAEAFENQKIRGSYERIDAYQVVATFEMPEDFESTPTITLVAPGKALDINRLTRLYINGVMRSALSTPQNACGNPATPGCVPVCQGPPDGTCVSVAAWMFGKKPTTPTLAIEDVEIFRSMNNSEHLTALIHGVGFTNPNAPPPGPGAAQAEEPIIQEVLINGRSSQYRFVSPTLLMADFPAPTDENIKISLVSGEDTINAPAVANPAFLKIKDVSVVTYVGETPKSPGVLVVKIEGSGFSRNLEALLGNELEPLVGDLIVQSPTRAILKIKNPEAVIVVTLRDRVTGISVKTVVARKPPPRRRRS